MMQPTNNTANMANMVTAAYQMYVFCEHEQIEFRQKNAQKRKQSTTIHQTQPLPPWRCDESCLSTRHRKKHGDYRSTNGVIATTWRSPQSTNVVLDESCFSICLHVNSIATNCCFCCQLLKDCFFFSVRIQQFETRRARLN